MDCLFCQIVDKKLKADVVYEDDAVVAFKDINPQAPHHLLIVPKQHIATLNELSPKSAPLIGKMSHIAKALAKELGIDEDGYRLVMNCNEGAGQSVFHIHMHLLGGRRLTWPPG